MVQMTRINWRAVAQSLLRPEMVALLPALTLGSYWLGGERLLLLLAVTLPALTATLASMERRWRNQPAPARATPPRPETELLRKAFERGEFRAFFQPQLSTDTGRISGMEVLARWQHPEQGLLAPAMFLPAIEAAGLSERLSEIMIAQGLSAIKGWDAMSLHVPTVAVNLSAADLRNPRLTARLQWELERFDLAPSRFTVEILETVAAALHEDAIEETVRSLSAIGCGIDLDDFGVRHGALDLLRRYPVRRIKIDRSFVTRLDQDRNQQRMLTAILCLADQLGLTTLAEGVETTGEHTMLAQLGCGHVQGYGIARPMGLSDATIWIEQHRAKLTQTPQIGRRAS
ncbi:EAL domain-containing protein [Halodurantibacterium flavum]|uniref:EAL domain-containing protein n=1 Tax=Halodurantibacterium flavum TaxID=1382802 RepID=A0ABW4S6M1_9RHOB